RPLRPGKSAGSPTLAIHGRWQAALAKPQLEWLLAGRARRDVAVRGATRRIRRGANGFLVRSGWTRDRGRQRLSVPSPQSADPDHQQALLGRPGAIGVDDPRAHQW